MRPTRRFIALFALLFIAIIAVPAKAETTYYALSFNSNAYVELPLSVKPTVNDTDRTIIIFGYFPPQDLGAYQDHKDIIRGSNNFGLSTATGFNTDGKILLWGTYYNSGVAWSIKSTSSVLNKNAMIVGVWDYNASTSTSAIKLYINAKLEASATVSGVTFNDTMPTNPLKIGTGFAGPFKGKIYLVLIYNRTLSDSEILQIYIDPWNPPTSGLILWYAPDSVDAINNIWVDKILGNNGTIYGAIAEQVNIPELYVYDTDTSQQIPYSNVSIILFYNNTKVFLVPSFPVLPYNASITLNVSAIGYESSEFSISTPVDTISVYLRKLSSIVQVVPSNFTIVIANITSNITMDDIMELFSKWPGGKFLRGLFHLNLKEFIRDMFSMPVTVGSKNLSWVGTFVALIIWTQGVLGAWYYFKDPVVVFTFGNILYKGLSEFITFNPAAMAVPLSMFSLYMGYLLLKKILAKWSGDI